MRIYLEFKIGIFNWLHSSTTAFVLIGTVWKMKKAKILNIMF